MNFFSVIWMKIANLFKSADLKPLDPVPVKTAEDLEEIDNLLEDIEKVKAMSPMAGSEVVAVDIALFKAMQDAPVAKEVVEEEECVEVELGQLSKNFHIDEFATHDGTVVPEELKANVLKLAINLQVLRDHLGKPVNITSGYRHPAYNKKIGGAKNSQHMKATAADIKVKGIGPDRLASIIEDLIAKGEMEKGGVGRYPTFTHYDVRGKNARWGGTRKKG